ncbi:MULTISPECIES: nuclear transport factor 2 family protein [Ensifer]|uniref:nuclear transport factor 2 family protein n=1 Tax=Ensifer TaxID=106591 RepID=UPI0008073BC3|nr:nuclear transport factor 2 family protein [Ensifer adhaerens]
MSAPNNPQFAAIVEVLQRYFDGLYRSDTSILKQVFHPKALYATATDGTLLELDMDRYFPVVDKRPSPESRGEERADRILSIELAGPVTALAKVQCAIGERAFADLLSLVFVDGRWQIIAKVFHYDIKPAK